jgi:signal peptidase II|tara:strand:- start:237 stop:740 length:504 start_codon:yes stop_codon:yes gene_type:complete
MIIKNFNKKFLINFSLVLILFFIDRFSKLYVINLDKELFGPEIFTSKFLNIHLIWNKGIAFGLFSFSETYFYNLISIIIAIIIFALLIMIIRSESLKRFLLILILGGALGNFYDRLIYKAVPDFIDFHVNDFHWFIFNVADIFISIGVFFVILYEIIDNNLEKNEKN